MKSKLMKYFSVFAFLYASLDDIQILNKDLSLYKSLSLFVNAHVEFNEDDEVF